MREERGGGAVLCVQVRGEGGGEGAPWLSFKRAGCSRYFCLLLTACGSDWNVCTLLPLFCCRAIVRCCSEFHGAGQTVLYNGDKVRLQFLEERWATYVSSSGGGGAEEQKWGRGGEEEKGGSGGEEEKGGGGGSGCKLVLGAVALGGPPPRWLRIYFPIYGFTQRQKDCVAWAALRA